MKAQMKFQKYLCLALLILGAVTMVYSFMYCTGSLAKLGQCINSKGESRFSASEGKYDALMFRDIQGFNTTLMYFGLVAILAAVLLYVMANNSRRNYYVTNYVATGICAGADIVLSLIFFIMNSIWRGRFLNVDFAAWQNWYDSRVAVGDPAAVGPAQSTVWFDLGYIVYGLLLVAAVLLILNLVWKIKLMKGEKQLLGGNEVTGGAAV